MVLLKRWPLSEVSLYCTAVCVFLATYGVIIFGSSYIVNQLNSKHNARLNLPIFTHLLLNVLCAGIRVLTIEWRTNWHRDY